MEGKALYTPTPEEERQHQQRENLLTAIGILTSLGKTFERPEYWNESHQQRAAAGTSTEGRYYTFAELVEVRAAGEQPGTFAAREVKEIESTLQKVRELASREYYEGHPVYSYAKKYIGYLEGLEVEAERQEKHPGRPAAKKGVKLRDIVSLNDTQYSRLITILNERHRGGKFSPIRPVINALLAYDSKYKGAQATEQHEALSTELGNIGSIQTYNNQLTNHKDTGTNATIWQQITRQ